MEHVKHLFCSDLDQNRAIFWSKSEIETPETRGTPETLWAHGLLMPEIFFESPGILLCQYVEELAGKDNVSGGGRQDQNGMSRFWIHKFHGFRFLSRILLIFGIATTDLSRLFPVAALSPSCASGFAFACMSTIRHLRRRVW